MKHQPAYILAFQNGVLEDRVLKAQQMLTSCLGCGWKCRVNRLDGETGKCRIGRFARVSSYGAHHGEEPPISGWRGSGTIFFTGCNLFCQFCQNHDISQTINGEEVSASDLAGIMLHLQAIGCHNINLVSPSHVVPQIIEAIYVAASQGLRLPVVFNSGGYDSLESLQLLNSLIDIYMPDMKYDDASIAARFSKIPAYPATNRLAVKEMHRQVGDLQIDPAGIAYRGLLVRHLVLPNRLAGTQGIVDFLANEVSTQTCLNLMDQYWPHYHANQFPEISRPVTKEEYRDAVQWAKSAGLHRLIN